MKRALLFCGAAALICSAAWAQDNSAAGNENNSSSSMTAQQKDMNNMPYSKVKAMLSTPAGAAKAMEMAKKNNVLLMAGDSINGKSVTLTGELTGADCYLSQGEHGEHHALCAKACVSHGSPIVFLSQDGTVYLVLTPKDGKPYPTEVLNDLGKPGVTIQANELDSHGIKALAVQSVQG